LQKPLWASTGTKNKAYSDVMYIEGLIGPHTINSIPPETLDAFRDHGKVEVALGKNEIEAEEVIGHLRTMEINPHSIGQELTDEGVETFIVSYDELIEALSQKRTALARTEAA
jgi:transaldolase